MVEYYTFNVGVVGSSPTDDTKNQPILVLRVIHETNTIFQSFGLKAGCVLTNV